VKEALYKAGAQYGQGKEDMFISFRVTQLYETGAAIYVYFSIKFGKLDPALATEIYEEIEVKSREECFKYGGSISHHHGVGKLRKRFLENSFVDINLQNKMFLGIKNEVDPKNIFACNNTIYRNEEERAADMAVKV